MPSILDPSVSRDVRDEFLGFAPIDKIVRRDVVTVRPDAAVSQAASIMCDRRINSLPVTSSGKLIGIVTSFDLLRLLERGG